MVKIQLKCHRGNCMTRISYEYYYNDYNNKTAFRFLKTHRFITLSNKTYWPFYKFIPVNYKCTELLQFSLYKFNRYLVPSDPDLTKEWEKLQMEKRKSPSKLDFARC
jgi:hypothetical protein